MRPRLPVIAARHIPAKLTCASVQRMHFHYNYNLRMGAGGSAIRKLTKDQLKQVKAGTVMASVKERTLQILYGRFTYLYLTSFKDQAAREKAS